MSVINKMLRDLDQRQAPQTPGNAKPAEAVVRRGTASVATAPVLAQRAGPFTPATIAAVSFLLVLVTGCAYWWWQKSTVVAVPPVATQSPALAPSAVAPASLPAPVTAPATASTPPSESAIGSVLAEDSARTPSKPIAAAPPQGDKAVTKPLAKATAEAHAQAPGSARESGKVSTPAQAPAQASAVAPPQSVAATGAATSADPQAAQARQLQAGREALAQAQSLWNAGSHDAASELLQQALVLAERTAGSFPTVANTQLLATLAREQARVQIANGRPQAALDGLSRLESYIGQDADAWAMRGNAAQRLGRHQDSVRAYTTALQIRPNEQRWLLGAAVSQAALGQTASASEMAAKARALGPISKEVQSYLRQSGVSLSEP